MNPEFIDALTSDCRILLSRALNGKTINAFGLDGFGQYGNDDRGHQFAVHDVAVVVDGETVYASFANGARITGTAYVSLYNYDSTITGHIITDRNLAISLDQLLIATSIDPDCWSWPADTSREGINFFTFQLDVTRLIGW